MHFSFFTIPHPAHQVTEQENDCNNNNKRRRVSVQFLCFADEDFKTLPEVLLLEGLEFWASDSQSGFFSTLMHFSLLN